MANVTRATLSTVSASNFPDNTSQLISPFDLRDWITDGIDSFVTQKDVSTFENAFYECRGSTLTAAATVNLSLATGNFVHVSGTTTITSFGTVSAGARFIVCFDDAVVVTYNATTLIIPGAANITTTAGDCMMLISEGAGSWRVVGYFPGTGLPVGTVTAVTASSPLSSSGGNAPNLSIPQATGSQDGYLDSADWTTFNNKLDTVDLTTDVTGILPVANGGSGTATPSLVAGTNVTISGSWPNQTINSSGGGSPGGLTTEFQYNNAGTFDGASELTYSGGFVQIETPKIGTGSGNGHFHIHSANSAPTGITDYLTMWWQKATRALGFRAETDTHETYIQLTAPTADRTITLPDASGNVVLDTLAQTLTNKTLTTPAITTPAVTGIASFDNGASAGEIRLLEGSGGGTNYLALKAAATLAANVSLTLPNADGSSGQVLQTNGSGTLSWVNNGGRPYITDITANTVTGTSEQLLISVLIPANTFVADNHFQITFRLTRPANTGQSTWRFYLNTSAAIGGTNFGSWQIASNANTSFKIVRSFSIINATTTTNYNSVANNVTTDFGSGTNTNAAIDWTVNQYLVVSAQSTSATGDNSSRAIIISQI